MSVQSQFIGVSSTPIFINNQVCATSSTATLPVVNPCNEQIITHISVADSKDVDKAVNAARAAFDNGCWSGLAPSARAEYLRAIAKEVTAKQEHLALIEALDSGKPFKETEWDIEDVAGCFDYYAEQAEILEKNGTKQVPLGMDTFTGEIRHEPMGVVGAIIPWNYPLLMFAWKVAPALAAGCTVVIKPSELTPLSALEFIDIARKVQLPRGVLNIITGDGSTGGSLCEHSGIDKIAFTGSVPTGKSVGRTAAQSIKNCTLELGGKSPLIVYDDVKDIDKAVEWVMFGVFWTNGQICSSTSRLLIQSGIAPKFLAKLAEHTNKIELCDVNDPVNKNKTGIMGPVVSKNQHSKVMNYILGALEQGAEVLCGGQEPANFDKGYYVQPTVLKVSTEMDIWKEEVFGPVLSVVVFNEEKEALALANDTEFGLGAAVISDDKAQCERAVKALRAGIVWVNCSQPCFVQLPWGGLKKSGVGRELSANGIYNYLEPKQVVTYTSDEPWAWYPSITAKSKL
jgi:betaine-aldehyde dehydrogenase